MFGRDARESDDGGKARRREMVGGHVPEERRVAAWIGGSIVIKGNLTSSEDMTIAGQVEGDVALREHTLVIAPRARIRGNIFARAVAVHGEVEGGITAEHKVEIGETGSVSGDITAPRMVVVEGGVLRGGLRVGGSSSPPSAPAPSSTSSQPA